jgi:hypothetical protein
MGRADAILRQLFMRSIEGVVCGTVEDSFSSYASLDGIEASVDGLLCQLLVPGVADGPGRCVRACRMPSIDLGLKCYCSEADDAKEMWLC